MRGETREGEGGGLTSPWMILRRTRISPERHGARRPSRAAARRFADMPLSSERTAWRAASSTSRHSPSFAAPATELMYAEKMKRTRRKFPCLPRQSARRGAPLSGPKRPWRSSSLPPRGATLHWSRVDGGHLVCLSAPPAARSVSLRALASARPFSEPPGSYGIRGISELNVEIAVFVFS